MRLLIGFGMALMAASACGQPAPQSRMAMVGPPASEAPRTRLSVESAPPSPSDMTLPPLTCKDWVAGFVSPGPEATGIADPVEATRTTQAVNHLAGDAFTKTGNNTQIVRDGEIIYFGEWRRAEDGTWLLESYRTCASFVPRKLSTGPME